MIKTYRSLFLACDACKQQADSDAKCCKYCGKIIWLKDAKDVAVPTPTEVQKTITQSAETPTDVNLQIEKLQQQLESLSRAKLEKNLQKWLPTIFEDYYYVAPNPMPKNTLDLLVKHMGKKRAYNMSILGYGFDQANQRIYVFGEQAMLYKAIAGDGTLYEIPYSSIKEVTAGNGQLIIKTDSGKTMYISHSREQAMAELLGSITGANIKLFEKVGTTKKVTGQEPTAKQVDKPADVTEPSGNSQPNKAPAKNSVYTIKDYIREHTGGFMLLIMLVTRVCLGAQCGVSCSWGGDAIIYGIIFGVFALAIGYTRPWIMVGCWFYCVMVSDDPSIGTGSNDDWFGGVAVFLTLALVCRFILWIKYKIYMKKGKKQ